MALTAITKDGRRCYAVDGRVRYVSVSAALDLIFPSAGYMDPVAMARGTACHEWLAKYLKAPFLATTPPDQEVLDRVIRVTEWLRDHNAFAMDTETTFVHLLYGYAGTLDVPMMAMLGGPTVVDWKFAEDIPDRYLFQMEMYLRFPETKGFRGLILQVGKDLIPREHWVKPEAQRWAICTSAVNVLRYQLGLS
jgi:hypothetical protein